MTIESINEQHTALLAMKIRARDSGLTKLEMTPGGGGSAGM